MGAKFKQILMKEKGSLTNLMIRIAHDGHCETCGFHSVSCKFRKAWYHPKNKQNDTWESDGAGQRAPETLSSHFDLI